MDLRENVERLLDKLTRAEPLTPTEVEFLEDEIADEIDYVIHADFDLPSAESLFIPPKIEAAQFVSKYLDLYIPNVQLSNDTESQLFLSYNYSRFRLKRAWAIVKAENIGPATNLQTVIEFERWLKAVTDICGTIQESYLRIVLQCVLSRNYGQDPHDAQDLFQFGALCLLRPIRRFDASRKLRFENYARSSVNLEIMKECVRRARIRQSECELAESPEGAHFIASEASGDEHWRAFIVAKLPKLYGTRYVRKHSTVSSEPSIDGPDEAFVRGFLRRAIASRKCEVSPSTFCSQKSEIQLLQEKQIEFGTGVVPPGWRTALLRKTARHCIMEQQRVHSP